MNIDPLAAEMRQKAEAATTECATFDEYYQLILDDRDRLKAEVVALRKDAERWHKFLQMNNFVVCDADLDGYTISNTELTTAIDAAIEGEGK